MKDKIGNSSDHTERNGVVIAAEADARRACLGNIFHQTCFPKITILHKNIVGPNQETRGKRKVLSGVVVSDKMNKTRTVTVERLVHDERYGKTLKRAAKFHAHDEANESKIGDKVEIMSTRPVSKTTKWRISKIVEKARN